MDYFKSCGIEIGKGRFYEEVTYSIALLYHLIDTRVTSALAVFNLTPAKFNVLMVLKHQGGTEGMSQVDISKRLIVTPSNMTRLLDKLEKEGLAQRSMQKKDRRIKTIKITQKGSRLLDEAWPVYTTQIKGIAGTITLDDQQSLAKLLIKMLNNLSKG